MTNMDEINAMENETLKEHHRQEPTPVVTREDVVNLIHEQMNNFASRMIFNNIVGLKNLASNPDTGFTGQLAVVGGKLKIYDGSAWATVGTQT